MGALLVDGIGDTMRVSLTADPVEEVKVACEILKALGLRERGPILIACPSCGTRQRRRGEARRAGRGTPGHVRRGVRGRRARLRRQRPWRGRSADFGIAGGRDVGFVYAHGRVLKKVPSDVLVDEELFGEIDAWIAAACRRPKRLKMAKPAGACHGRSALIPLD